MHNHSAPQQAAWLRQAAPNVRVTLPAHSSIPKGNHGATPLAKGAMGTYATLVTTYGVKAHTPSCLGGAACNCGATPSNATKAANLRNAWHAMGSATAKKVFATLTPQRQAAILRALKA